MSKRYGVALILLLFANNIFASACIRTEWDITPSEFTIIENCESSKCNAPDKWDLIYFSADIFQYKLDSFYDIKKAEYLSKHCLAKIKGQRSGIEISRAGEKALIQDIEQVVLINASCPNVGAKVKGHLVFQMQNQFTVSPCAKGQETGRVYLKVVK